jgi:hypothetical protein
MPQTTLNFFNNILAERLNKKSYDFLLQTQEEIKNQVAEVRFTAFISLVSRFVARQPLALSISESAKARAIMPGWNIENWSLLEAARVSFILARTDLLSATFVEAYNKWFSYADEGELCAYYRAIPLIPEPQRLVWRAAEGCRTNMKTIFMAVACDSPFPHTHFDDVAWNQLVVKALFTEVPLARIHGIDKRLSTELTLMVLDYMDERKSAGRDIPVDAWLCISMTTDARFDKAVTIALQSSFKQQAAAVVALGRAQREKDLQKLLTNNIDPPLKNIATQVLNGKTAQSDFHELVSHFEG